MTPVVTVGGGVIKVPVLRAGCGEVNDNTLPLDVLVLPLSIDSRFGGIGGVGPPPVLLLLLLLVKVGERVTVGFVPVDELSVVHAELDVGVVPDVETVVVVLDEEELEEEVEGGIHMEGEGIPADEHAPTALLCN